MSPQSTLPLKTVPFENGDGQPLEICPHCHGSGKYIRGFKLTPNGRSDVRYLREQAVAVAERDGYSIERGPCMTCKRAGTVLVGAVS